MVHLGSSAGWSWSMATITTPAAQKDTIHVISLSPATSALTWSELEGSGLPRADRFAALRNAGRTIAAATSAAAVREAVADAIVVVLGAERCQVLDVPVPGDWGRAGGAESAAAVEDLRRSLFQQAVQTAQVVTASPNQARPGARSALCAPISRGGRVVACFFATHGTIAGLFGDEERRLAAFLAALAGATLEHVAGTEARFRALVRNSHDLTVVADPAGRVLYLSPSITPMLGYGATDLSALASIRLVHPEDRHRVLTTFRLVRFSPAAHPTAEVRVRHRNGSWRWLEMTMTNLLADTSVRGLVLHIRDVTDRKHAELALIEATEQFRLSFENAPIGMAMTNIAPGTPLRWVRVNQALADMLGYSRHELEARTVAEMTHPDDVAADIAAVARYQRSEATSFTTVKRYRHADGRWIWVQLQTNLIANDGGHRWYVISQMLDITERRAVEDRLTFLALHDPLTGLANRRLLHDRLSLALARAARSGHSVAVFYIDLDGFKDVNDSYGHDQGDETLLQVASRLRAEVRECDTLARVGGDEFVLVADGLAGPADAAAIAHRIGASLRSPLVLDGVGELSITASVGVATSGAGAGATTLLRQADAAMYDVKQRRRRGR